MVQALVPSRIVSDVALPPQYTHILRPGGGEDLRANDHIFAVQPQPATQSPFLRAEAGVVSIEAGGELVHTSPALVVLVN